MYGFSQGQHYFLMAQIRHADGVRLPSRIVNGSRAKSRGHVQVLNDLMAALITT